MSNKRLRSETRKATVEADRLPKLVSFAKADVPAYLHQSEFYLSLEEDDHQQILVPRECFKSNDSISSAEDLRSILLTLRFWVAGEKCRSVLDFIFNHPFESYEEVIADFYDDRPDLIHLKAIVKSRKRFLRAIDSGVLPFVRCLLQTGKYVWPEDVCEQLAMKGDLEMLRFAVTSGCSLSIDATVGAAMSGCLDCLKFLHERNCPWDETTTDAAVIYGNLNCLQYAHENGCPWNDMAVLDEEDDYDWSNMCSGAAAYGHVDCLRYAYSQGVPLLADLYERAIESKQGAAAMECMVFAHERGLPQNDKMLCEAAVWTGNLEMLIYLRENGCPWNRKCFRHAIEGEHVEIFHYLFTNNCPWHKSVCECAAREECLTMVLHLLRNGCPPSNNIWTFKGDDFHQILRTFEEEGFAWSATPSAMKYVVQHNDLNLVKLMRGKGFPWTKDICQEISIVGSLELLEYAYTHGAGNLVKVCAELMSLWDRNRVYTAAQVECFKYAHQHSHCALSDELVVQAARDGQLELLTYLHEWGCKWDAKAAVVAAQNGHADCLEYLLSQGCPHSKDIVIAAARRRQEKCLEVAKKYGCV